MRKQRDDNSNDLQIAPRVLAVPPELEATARALINSQELGAAAGSPTGNPFFDTLAVVSESRLSNPKFAGYSATAYYVLSGPTDAPVIVGFLDGRQGPIVEIFGFDSDPNVLALQFRVIHDFGCALGDYRAAVMATGGY
jgi:hypothetical protein